MLRLILALMLPLILAACGAESVWAPDEEVQRAIYRSDAPPSITVFTVVSTSNGSGGHSSLLINGSQRLLFDPAGTFNHPQLPERNDVLFGMKDAAVEFYKVPKADCTQANTDILSGLPGFEGVPRTFFPVKLMKYVDTLPNVKRSVFSDDSPANNATIVAPNLR